MFADFHKVEISPNLRGRLNRWDRVLIIPLHKIVGFAEQASHPPHESGFQSRTEFRTKFVSADMLNEVKSAEFQVFQFQLNYRRQFYIQILHRNLLHLKLLKLVNVNVILRQIFLLEFLAEKLA